jgi:hypothetical protein
MPVVLKRKDETKWLQHDSIEHFVNPYKVHKCRSQLRVERNGAKQSLQFCSFLIQCIILVHNALNNLQTKANISGKWKDAADKSRIDGKLEIENQTIRLFTDIKTENKNIHLEKKEKLAKEYHRFIVMEQKIFPQKKKNFQQKYCLFRVLVPRPPQK